MKKKLFIKACAFSPEIVKDATAETSGTHLFFSMDERPQWPDSSVGLNACRDDDFTVVQIPMDQLATEKQVVEMAKESEIFGHDSAMDLLLNSRNLILQLRSNGFIGFVEDSRKKPKAEKVIRGDLLVFDASAIVVLDGVQKKLAMAHIDQNTHSSRSPWTTDHDELVSFIKQNKGLSAHDLKQKIDGLRYKDPHFDLNSIDQKARSDASFLFLVADRIETMAVLLDHGANPAVRNSQLQNALHFSPDEASIRWLQQQGLDINTVDDNGETPLHRACYSCDPSRIAMLIRAGADVHAKDLFGNTPLHPLVQSGKAGISYPHELQACMSILLENGVDLEVRNAENETALHMAAAHGNEMEVLTLIQAGADIDAEDHRGLRPIHFALRNGHSARALIALGANTRGVFSPKTPIDKELTESPFRAAMRMDEGPLSRAVTKECLARFPHVSDEDLEWAKDWTKRKGLQERIAILHAHFARQSIDSMMSKQMFDSVRFTSPKA